MRTFQLLMMLVVAASMACGDDVQKSPNEGTRQEGRSAEEPPQGRRPPAESDARSQDASAGNETHERKPLTESQAREAYKILYRLDEFNEPVRNAETCINNSQPTVTYDRCQFSGGLVVSGYSQDIDIRKVRMFCDTRRIAHLRFDGRFESECQIDIVTYLRSDDHGGTFCGYDVDKWK